MWTLLSKLAAELSAVVDTMMWVIQRALFANRLAVDFVARCGQASLDIVLYSACQLRCACVYFIQDFFSFAADVSSMACFTLVVLGQGFMHVCCAVHFVWALVVGCVTGAFAGILWALNGIGLAINAINWTIFSSVALVWGAVTLIGHSVIYVLCAIPRTIVINVIVFVNAAYAGAWMASDIFLNICRNSLKSTVAVAQWTVAAVVAIPGDAYLGLALYCLFHYSVKYLLRCQRFRHSSVRILRTVRYVLSAMRPTAWFQLFASWSLFWPYRNDSNEDDRSGADESDASDNTDNTVATPYLARGDSSQSTSGRPEAQTPRSEMLDEVFRLKRQLSLEKENRLCIVCQDRDKCVLIMPCRHLCLCQECSEEIHGSCPMCRNRIAEMLLVFS